MVKLVVLIAAVAVISNVSAWKLFPDASNAETVAYSNKIASGGAPAKGFGADYVLLSVVFVQQAQICGGVLVTDSYVLTSASCLVDPVEGPASFVNVAVGGTNKFTLNFTSITVHPGYVPATYANNLAFLKLTVPAKVDGKKIATASLDVIDNAATDYYVSDWGTICGYGTTANAPTAPKGMQCINTTIIAATTCSANTATFCTGLQISDKNVCPGDYGGPIYYTGSTPPLVIGIASYAPLAVRNAPCTDGHVVEYSQLAAFTVWIDSVLHPAPPTYKKAEEIKL